MSSLNWASPNDRSAEIGIDRGVVYFQGVAPKTWPGLISVMVSAEESRVDPIYQDGEMVTNHHYAGDFAGVVEAFTYPSEFDREDSPAFNFTYRSRVISGMSSEESYRIHLIYNAQVSPATKQYQMSEASNFSWELSAIPVYVPRMRPAAHLIVDTEMVDIYTLRSLENLLYGETTLDGKMPTPEELIELFGAYGNLEVIDNHDGTFTITGPEERVISLPRNRFQVTSKTIELLEDGKFTISSETKG